MSSDSAEQEEMMLSPSEAASEQEPDNAASTTSIDSETVLLNPQPDLTSARPLPQRSNTNLKQCWICYADETEDTSTTSRWRSPCPCALVAHESCLLDWVADLEAPGSRRTRGSSPKIQCPQCKKDIIISRPKSYVVEATKAIERAGSRLVIPGALFALGGGLLTTAAMHGLTSVFLIFGKRDADNMLKDPFLAAKWLITLPSIPVALILSRTTLVDRILPTVPLLIYASEIPQNWGNWDHIQLWPPSPELAFSALPFIRSVYKQLWRRLISKREAQWVREVQPRAGEATDQADPAAENVQVGEEAGLDIFNFQVEIVDDDEAIPRQPVNNNPQPQGPQNNPPQQEQEQQPRAVTISGTYLADLVMGALTFPLISSAMGSLLNLALPYSWTHLPINTFRFGLNQFRGSAGNSRSRPFLASQWARSLVGGCLFVVVKDTLLLYAKYRAAKDHRKRRICEWDRKLGMNVD